MLILIISNFRYNHLNKEYNKLKIQNTEQVDSLVYVNKTLEKQVSNYKAKVITLEEAIDSLQEVKSKIVIKKDNVVVSKSTADGVVLLQKNLSR